MLKFCSLYSGSSGNCLLVQSENTNILIDAGVSCKKIEEGLNTIDVDPSSINAILVTHEHIDHVQSLGTLSKKFNLPVFANAETFDAMPNQVAKINSNNIKKFKISEKFCIGNIEVSPFNIPHDAANPCGFNLFNNGKKISIATDIGHMTNSILKNLENSNLILLEANYDAEVLKYTKYPFSLKTRIAGPTGHLSNEMAGKTINYLYKNGLETAILGHLSKESNFPELAYKTVINELLSDGSDTSKINISVANRNVPSKLINI